jgi:hypothetical protein
LSVGHAFPSEWDNEMGYWNGNNYGRNYGNRNWGNNFQNNVRHIVDFLEIHVKVLLYSIFTLLFYRNKVKILLYSILNFVVYRLQNNILINAPDEPSSRMTNNTGSRTFFVYEKDVFIVFLECNLTCPLPLWVRIPTLASLL